MRVYCSSFFGFNSKTLFGLVNIYVDQKYDRYLQSNNITKVTGHFKLICKQLKDDTVFKRMDQQMKDNLRNNQIIIGINELYNSTTT